MPEICVLHQNSGDFPRLIFKNRNMKAQCLYQSQVTPDENTFT